MTMHHETVGFLPDQRKLGKRNTHPHLNPLPLGECGPARETKTGLCAPNVHTHTHTQTHTHKNTHTQKHTHTQTHTHKHPKTHACTQTHTQRQLTTHRHTHTLWYHERQGRFFLQAV